MRGVLGGGIVPRREAWSRALKRIWVGASSRQRRDVDEKDCVPYLFGLEPSV